MKDLIRDLPNNVSKINLYFFLFLSLDSHISLFDKISLMYSFKSLTRHPDARGFESRGWKGVLKGPPPHPGELPDPGHSTRYKLYPKLARALNSRLQPFLNSYYNLCTKSVIAVRRLRLARSASPLGIISRRRDAPTASGSRAYTSVQFGAGVFGNRLQIAKKSPMPPTSHDS